MTFKVALVSNLGSGQQLQVQQEVESVEDLRKLADLVVDIGHRQTARVSLPVSAAKITTIEAQIEANAEMIKVIEAEIRATKAQAVKTGSGKIANISDVTTIDNLTKTLFEKTLLQEKLKVECGLARIEHEAHKTAAGVV